MLASISDEQVARIAELAADGAPFSRLHFELFAAKQITRASAARVVRVLKRLDLYEIFRRTPRHGIASTKGLQIRELCAQGKTMQAIADATGVSKQRIEQLLKKHGCASVRERNRAKAQAIERYMRFGMWLECDAYGMLMLEAARQLVRIGVLADWSLDRFGHGARLSVGGEPVKFSTSTHPLTTGPGGTGPLYYRFNVACPRSYYAFAIGERACVFPPQPRGMAYVRADGVGMCRRAGRPAPIAQWRTAS